MLSKSTFHLKTMSMGGVCTLPFVWPKAWWIIRCTCSHYVITLIIEKSLIYFSLHYCWKTALSRENFERCRATGRQTTSEDGVFLQTGVTIQIFHVTKEPNHQFHWCESPALLFLAWKCKISKYGHETRLLFAKLEKAKNSFIYLGKGSKSFTKTPS